MASRMDRYNKDEFVTSGRSSKNKSLYEQIESLENYTNIEGVATIEKTNEIDISKVQEMIKNREEYKKRRELRGIIDEKKEEKIDTPEIEEKPRNYDIKSLLSMMEKETKNENKVRSLDPEQYEMLKTLKNKSKKYDVQKEEEELKELINTINMTKTNLDVGLLDDLKSDTMVGDASSIKKIIEDEKKDVNFDATNTEIDHSFYTSSFGFTKSDFEELKNMNKDIKKNNKFIMILLTIFIVLVIVGSLLFLILKWVNYVLLIFILIHIIIIVKVIKKHIVIGIKSYMNVYKEALYFDAILVMIDTIKQIKKYTKFIFLNLKIDLIIFPMKYVIKILKINMSRINCIDNMLSILDEISISIICFNAKNSGYSYSEDNS